mmetsp:Transcript_140960/g.351481  ORF Transcript_140960/g.351481 Transcript_140960/m.351481 type:complete len:253 (+) Transcript_140960:306-1064(+)
MVNSQSVCNSSRGRSAAIANACKQCSAEASGMMQLGIVPVTWLSKRSCSQSSWVTFWGRRRSNGKIRARTKHKLKAPTASRFGRKCWSARFQRTDVVVRDSALVPTQSRESARKPSVSTLNRAASIESHDFADGMSICHCKPLNIESSWVAMSCVLTGGTSRPHVLIDRTISSTTISQSSLLEPTMWSLAFCKTRRTAAHAVGIWRTKPSSAPDAQEASQRSSIAAAWNQSTGTVTRTPLVKSCSMRSIQRR